MPFPLSKSGSFRVETTGPADQHVAGLETALLDWLAYRMATGVARPDHSISFKGGVIRKINYMSVISTVDSGTFQLSPQGSEIEFSYSLRFTELFLIVTGMVLFIFGPAALGAAVIIGDREAIMRGVAIVIVGWFWLFGGNYLIAIFLVPIALKKVARRATGGTII
ncbi:MAG: hypothetical protein O7F69_05750 [Alphaproteobacteria bacterium]|nr:hypothetical protein [Alphaproteobacteria bacterium]